MGYRKATGVACGIGVTLIAASAPAWADDGAPSGDGSSSQGESRETGNLGDEGRLEGPTFRGDDASMESEIAGEVLVDLRDDVSARDLADLRREYRLDFIPSSTWSETHDKLEVVRVAPTFVRPLLERLAKDPRVESAEPSRSMELPLDTPNGQQPGAEDTRSHGTHDGKVQSALRRRTRLFQ